MSKTQAKTARALTGADVRVERNRYTPIVTQVELAEKAGMYASAISPIENGDIEVTQAQLEKMIEAVRAVVAEREKAEAAE